MISWIRRVLSKFIYYGLFYLNVDIQISYRFNFSLEKILQHQGKFVGTEVCGTT